MNILESLSVLHYVFQICNLSQTVLDSKSWTTHKSLFLRIYNILVLSISLAMLFYGLFGDTGDMYKNTSNDIGQTVDFIQLVGVRVAHVVSVTESILRRKDLENFFKQVKEIDGIFENSLNTEVDNRKFRSTILQRGALVASLYVCTELFILVIKLIGNQHHYVIYWIFYLFPYLVCGLRYYQTYILIFIIKKRLDKLANILNTLNLNQSKFAHDILPPPATVKLIAHGLPLFETAERLSRRYDMENPQLKRLLTVREIYNRLWELSTMVNASVGISLLFNVGNDFISITSNCYWIFLNFKEYSSTPMDYLQIAASAVYSIPHVFNVLVLALICERTVLSTTNIALGLHRIKIDILNDNHNTVVEQFSLQLLHQKITFTAAGFFTIDCSLLYTVVAATTTYLIILIQFHMTETKPDD